MDHVERANLVRAYRAENKAGGKRRASTWDQIDADYDLTQRWSRSRLDPKRQRVYDAANRRLNRRYERLNRSRDPNYYALEDYTR